jgi:hypothetical protein
MTPAKWALSILPFVWIIGMVPFINHVHPIIFGLPFLAFWLFSGNFVVFFCLKIIHHIDAQKNAKK